MAEVLMAEVIANKLRDLLATDPSITVSELGEEKDTLYFYVITEGIPYRITIVSA